MTVSHSLIANNEAVGGVRAIPAVAFPSAPVGEFSVSLGVLTVTDTAFIGNRLIAGDGAANVPGCQAGGGALDTEGAVTTVTRCLFVGNSAIGGAGGAGAPGGGADGGAIAIGTHPFGGDSPGSVDVVNSIFIGNSAVGGRGGSCGMGGTRGRRGDLRRPSWHVR